MAERAAPPARPRGRHALRSRAFADELVRVAEVEAGLHVVLGFAGVTEAEVLATIRRHDVVVDALTRHWMGAPQRSGIVVGYATPAEHAFGPALDALIAALREISS